MTAVTAPQITLADPQADGSAAVAEPIVLPTRAPAIRMWSTRQSSPAVRRPRLTRVLRDPAAPPLVLLVAPAGYGKTTLLREWSTCDERPFAWVTLDQHSNDPRRLLADVARAVDGAVGDDGTVPFVLVLDDVQALHRPAAIDTLRAVANDLPACATRVLSGRSEPALPLARLRAQHLVCELGPVELAMTRAEASAVLNRAGHELDRDALEMLLERTEGWPVALTLAALSLGDRAAAGSPERFDGTDRLVVQYLHDEVLAELPAELLQFARRTSVVETLTGSLCDVLLQRSGSAATLQELVRAGLAVSLDRTDQRYRYRRLIGEMLRGELARTAPELEAELHARASAWHRAGGDIDRAIDHALRAGDVREAGDVVWASVGAASGRNRNAHVERWRDRFGDGEDAAHPIAALTAAPACASPYSALRCG